MRAETAVRRAPEAAETLTTWVTVTARRWMDRALAAETRAKAAEAEARSAPWAATRAVARVIAREAREAEAKALAAAAARRATEEMADDD